MLKQVKSSYTKMIHKTVHQENAMLSTSKYQVHNYSELSFEGGIIANIRSTIILN